MNYGLVFSTVIWCSTGFDSLTNISEDVEKP